MRASSLAFGSIMAFVPRILHIRDTRNLPVDVVVSPLDVSWRYCRGVATALAVGGVAVVALSSCRFHPNAALAAEQLLIVWRTKSSCKVTSCLIHATPPKDVPQCGGCFHQEHACPQPGTRPFWWGAMHRHAHVGDSRALPHTECLPRGRDEHHPT
jgi:hypothetical protein